jgi:hypothetical protein
MPETRLEDDTKPDGPAHHHGAGALFVFVISTVILMTVLTILSHFGAKDFVDRMATQTAAALKDLNPTELWQRYFALVLSCLDYLSAVAHAHGLDWLNSVPGYGIVAATLCSIFGIAALLFGLLTETPIHAFVDLLQIVAGGAAMAVLLVKLTSGRSVVFLILLINGGILIASLISVPALWIMYLAASGAGDILPAQASVSCYGGACAGFIYGCTGAVFEGGLHHGITRVVERTIVRR